MFFALDSNENRVHISKVSLNEAYYCPCCGIKLILKMGDQKAHHFAHPANSYCKDTWHYDMSDWHINWQNRFPKQYQEIVKVNNGEKHRADVLIESKKVVLEFQHSPMSPDEFEDRNEFYNSLGYKVIWIFDVNDQYENGQIDNYRSNIWKWNHPKRTFNYYDSTNKNVQLYLELGVDDEDIPELVKVTWCTDDNGMSRFATDGKDYDDQDFIKMFIDVKKMNQKKETRLSELYDKMIELYSEDHTTYYFGCPISSTHKCANSVIDIPKRDYSKIMPCLECKYQIDNYDYYNEPVVCKKRFLDLNLDANTIVNIESKDTNGFINKISYIDNDVKKYITLQTFEQHETKDVFTLWEENKCSVATFRNIKTGVYIRIYKDPRKQQQMYHKVYGAFSNDKYSFPKTTVELYGVGNKDWILEWHK